MWRVVLGYSVALLDGVDDRGLWRPPGAHDIEVLVTPPIGDTPDPPKHRLGVAMDAAGWDAADCYLHCMPEYYPLPSDSFDVASRLAIAVCDWNMAGRVSHLLRPHVDAIVCDHAGVEILARPAGPPVVPGLLWGWDAASWAPAAVDLPRDIDVLFVGSRNQSIHQERERWLARLGRLGERHDVRIYSDVYGAEYRALHERARLVFNQSVRGEANMRSFEASSRARVSSTSGTTRHCLASTAPTSSTPPTARTTSKRWSMASSRATGDGRASRVRGSARRSATATTPTGPSSCPTSATRSRPTRVGAASPQGGSHRRAVAALILAASLERRGVDRPERGREGGRVRARGCVGEPRRPADGRRLARRRPRVARRIGSPLGSRRGGAPFGTL